MLAKLMALMLTLLSLGQGAVDGYVNQMNLGGNLFLVNRTYALAEDYVPNDLVTPKVKLDGTNVMMRREAAEALEKLFAGAKEAGYTLSAISGYRSYGRQKSIHNARVRQLGKEAADRISAPPGCSEHQLGLAMDLGTKKEIRLTAAFGETPEGQWVAANAHRFGFIIRYKAEWEEITGYAFEPWHIRYVGKDHARNIFNWDIPLEEYIDRQLSPYVVAEDEGENTQ